MHFNFPPKELQEFWWYLFTRDIKTHWFSWVRHNVPMYQTITKFWNLQNGKYNLKPRLLCKGLLTSFNARVICFYSDGRNNRGSHLFRNDKCFVGGEYDAKTDFRIYWGPVVNDCFDEIIGKLFSFWRNSDVRVCRHSIILSSRHAW